MKSKILRLLTVSMVLVSVGAAVGVAVTTPDKALKEIADYRKWTRLNEKPLLVNSAPDFGG